MRAKDEECRERELLRALRALIHELRNQLSVAMGTAELVLELALGHALLLSL